MANITLTNIPQTVVKWERDAKKNKIPNPYTASIHDPDLTLLSGSKGGNEQFFLCRTIWEPRMLGLPDCIPKKYLLEAKKILSDPVRSRQWLAFLERINEDPYKPLTISASQELGKLALVLQALQYASQITGTATIDGSKIDFSPIANRTRSQRRQSNPPRPETPTHSTSTQADPARPLDSDDSDVEMDDFSSFMASPVVQHSPVAGELAKLEGPARSEQEMVITSTILQRAVCMGAGASQVEITADQEAFRARSGNQPLYTARVDGVMRNAAIKFIALWTETKRSHRYCEPDAAAIKGQETFQLFAKVSGQPDEYLQKLKEDGTNETECWLAMNIHEFFFQRASFPPGWVAYTQGVKGDKFAIAKVKETGPFIWHDRESMSDLGILILALALQETDRQKKIPRR
ncbi:uncharacterized protein F4822DRAFT_429163 [Hypoxylon trugodes]|uniref:uncharacterized protein n=1 Tax=Hypoxylon trugodes TaxID=326681 RepID=UPI002193413D|nr:uncharacterized protein F4822DRAFT_429163 [Hypoxylon trugodes]KAI1388545.1 hypothetical protein F4822DRAFT_429163 [Hypoxylon trugodes]